MEEVNGLLPWESGKDKLEFLCEGEKKDIAGRQKDMSEAGRYEGTRLHLCL